MTAVLDTGRAMRIMLIILASGVMLLLAGLALRSLFSIPGSSQANEAGAGNGTGTAVTDPAGPLIADSPGRVAPPITGVRCGRAENGPDAGSLIVEIDGDAPTLGPEEIIVAVDLLLTDGNRETRQVSVPSPADSGLQQAVIGDTADPDRYVSCTVTALQQGKRVILTGS